jgi:hypothetical protein
VAATAGADVVGSFELNFADGLLLGCIEAAGRKAVVLKSAGCLEAHDCAFGIEVSGSGARRLPRRI